MLLPFKVKSWNSPTILLARFHLWKQEHERRDTLQTYVQGQTCAMTKFSFNLHNNFMKYILYNNFIDKKTKPQKSWIISQIQKARKWKILDSNLEISNTHKISTILFAQRQKSNKVWTLLLRN